MNCVPFVNGMQVLSYYGDFRPESLRANDESKGDLDAFRRGDCRIRRLSGTIKVCDKRVRELYEGSHPSGL